jgi:serine/threonine protein kinase
MSGLQHRNIIRLFAHVETPTHISLKMELMRGGDLFERLEKLVRGPSPALLCVYMYVYKCVSERMCMHMCVRVCVRTVPGPPL